MTQLTLDSLFAQAEAQQDLTIKNLSVLKLRSEDTMTQNPVTIYTVAIFGENIEKKTVANLYQHKRGTGYVSGSFDRWRNTSMKTVHYTVSIYDTRLCSPMFEVGEGAPITARKQALQWLVDQINQNNQ